MLTTGMLIFGKMSVGVRSAASVPRIKIRIAITTNVYGRLKASFTIHICIPLPCYTFCVFGFASFRRIFLLRNPLSDIRRAISQFGARALAACQEPYGVSVDEFDLSAVEDD